MDRKIKRRGTGCSMASTASQTCGDGDW